MKKSTIRYISRIWRDLLENKIDRRKDYILQEILDNNYNLWSLISKQVKVIEEYEKNTIGEVHKDNYIDTYDDILDLVEITSDIVEEEWDDETDRKS